MKLKPINDRVLVKRNKAEEVSKGGIVLPDVAKKKPRQGKVLALGKGIMLESGEVVPFPFKVGEEVIFLQDFEGKDEFAFEGEEYVILKAEDILAVKEKG